MDSVALLDALVRMRDETGIRLSAAHVHHGINAGADDWMRFCVALCAARAVPLSVHHITLPEKMPHGIEAAARDARHAVLQGLSADWVALAHHRDDQAETVLFRLLRGTGVRGAAAMNAIEPGAPGLLRPLLALPRSVVHDHARAQGLDWVEDPSNRDPHYTRNYLRHTVFPSLAEAFPAASEMLARAALNFSEAQALLDERAREDAENCALAASPVGVDVAHTLWSRRSLLSLSPERQRNLLRWVLYESGFESPARARLEEALRQIALSPGPLLLPCGTGAIATYRDAWWIEPAQRVPPQARHWAQENEVVWGAGRVVFQPVVGAGLDARRLAHGEVWLAPRRDGLRLQMDARRPQRSFKNLCQERGIPPWWRDELPVLYVADVPVWIGAIGSDVRWRCAPGAPGWQPLWQPWASD